MSSQQLTSNRSYLCETGRKWFGCSIFLQPLSESSEDADDGRHTLGNHIQVLVTFSSHGSFYSWVENYFSLLNLLSLTCCIFAHNIISFCVFIYFSLHWKNIFLLWTMKTKLEIESSLFLALGLGRKNPFTRLTHSLCSAVGLIPPSRQPYGTLCHKNT